MNAVFVASTGTTLTATKGIPLPLPTPEPVTAVLDKNVAVTLNGKPSSLGALRPGDLLVLSGNPVVSITAERPGAIASLQEEPQEALPVHSSHAPTHTSRSRR